uniref:Protein kinase domain-containing protein n=1 Tax=Wuchereria bancrofti TaxID=6293 RepID=A0A1I8ERU1_WUCBA
SPALPPSATAHELFRGFSYVAPSILTNDKPNLSINVISSHLQEAEKTYIFDEYNFNEDLGIGSFSVCRRCVHKKSGAEFAVKDNINVYLIEEICKGGELLSKIMMLKHFSEREAAAVMLRLANAISYLHSNQVVHRDLKPSNIMYASKTADPDSIRIIDFGFAKQLRAENGLLMTPCYTAQFVAPEILRKQGYDMNCDVWSLGDSLDKTYRALTSTTTSVPLRPVIESALARRRRLNRMKSIVDDDDDNIIKVANSVLPNGCNIKTG